MKIPAMLSNARRLFLLAGAACVALASLPACPKTPTYSIKYAEKRATLGNGLKLVVIPDNSTPMVQVDVRYEVGANEDPAGKAGLAHYVEHMMFQWRLFGADGPDLFTVLPQIVTGMNAYTSNDRTHYYLQAPAEDLPKLLDLEARRMNAAQSCPGNIPEAEFARELDVVRNEIRRSLGTAEGLIFPTILEKVYPEGHPYSHTPGGNDAQLVTITKEDVCKFMADYYVPRRATVFVAGNVDPEEVGRLVAHYFGDIPDKKPAARVPVKEVETQRAEYELEFDIERPVVAIVWSMPALSDKEFVKAQLAVGSLNGRLGQFVQDWDFAASAGATILGSDRSGGIGYYSPRVVLFIEPHKNSGIGEAKSWAWKAIRGAHRGLDFVELTAKEDIARERARYIMSLASLGRRTEEVANLMQFGEGQTEFDGTGEYILDQIAEMDEISESGYKSFTKKLFDKDKAVTFVFKAKSGGITGDVRAAGKLAKSTNHYADKVPLIDEGEADRPVTYPSEPGVLATAESYELGNGMKVVLLPTEGMPIVTAQLQFSVGSAHEPASKAGLAELAARFLLKPKGADSYYKIGAFYGSGAGMDSTRFTATGISTYTSEMIKSLERWIKAGYYNQEMLESWQEQFREGMKLESARMQVALQEELAKAVYGPDHPYAVKGSPTMDTYKKLDRDDLEAFRRKQYEARNATLIVAGNFDPESVKGAISSNFGGWGGGKPEPPVTQPAVERSEPEYVGVVGRDKQNAVLNIRYPGPVGIDENYGARLLISNILRQRMGKLRTRLGSTYGVYGGWSPNVGPSAYIMSGAVESMRAGESLAVMREEIDKLRQGEDFKVDFVRARRSVMKQLLAQSTESYNLAGALGRITQYGLPLDFDWQAMKQVATIKPEQVLELIRKDLDPSKELIAIMADEETLATTFEQVGVTARIIDVREKVSAGR